MSTAHASPPRHLMDLREHLRDVLWIGGGTGAGKSSVAIALAERYRLLRYNYDWHDSRDHSDRTDPARHPHRARFLRLTMDERWVLPTPEVMAEDTIAEFGERFEMVIEDLLGLPRGERVVAEGFGLLPELVTELIASPRQAVWLLPTPDFRARALAQRGWTIEGTSDPARACANKLARDELLTEHSRSTARRLGLRVIDVDGSKDLTKVTAIVERHFRPLLDAHAG